MGCAAQNCEKTRATVDVFRQNVHGSLRTGIHDFVLRHRSSGTKETRNSYPGRRCMDSRFSHGVQPFRIEQRPPF